MCNSYLVKKKSVFSVYRCMREAEGNREKLEVARALREGLGGYTPRCTMHLLLLSPDCVRICMVSAVEETVRQQA